METVEWHDAPVLVSDGTWSLKNYHDIKRALRDARFSAQRAPTIPQSGRNGFLDGLANALTPGRRAVNTLRGHWFAFQDAPDHTRLRGILQPLWAARVGKIQPRIELRVHELLDRVQKKRVLNVVTDLTFPLPALTISEILGLPLSAPTNFLEWFRDTDTLLGIHPHPPRGSLAQAHAAVEFFEKQIAARRAAPQDDLISDLVRAQAQGARISDAELTAAAIMVLIAGFQTLNDFFVHTLASFTRAPQWFHALKAEPDTMSSAVEELLRHTPQVTFVRRRLTTDVESNGIVLPRGVRVTMDIYAANHDPTVFDAPERFDLPRRPNPHLTFGSGAHFCLGSGLARLETQILLQELLQRFPTLEPANEGARQALAGAGLPYALSVRW